MNQQQRPEGSQQGFLTLVAVGDVHPNRDNPPSLFSHCGDVFRKADIVFGQMENPMSDRCTPALVPPYQPCKMSPTNNITALTEEGAGFDIMSFACNHSMDYGREAFLDTLEILNKNNIAVVGAGKNIEEARRPVTLEREGTRVGFIAYLSISSPNYMAGEDSCGCAPLRASNSYQQVDEQPGTPPLIITKLFPEDREAMVEDIKKLRPQVDVLVVSMHCGVHNVPATIAMYQKEAAYAAIDAGADLVLQHHAHILKGIEMYKGKAIFYGLGNFAAEHSADPRYYVPARRSLAREFYRIKPELKHTWRHDALKTLIVKAYIKGKNIQKVTYIPSYIDPATLEPEVVMRKDSKAGEVFDYVKQISETEDLNVHFSWEGDEVEVLP